MFDNEFETKEDKIWTKDKIEPPQNIYIKTFLGPKTSLCLLWCSEIWLVARIQSMHHRMQSWRVKRNIRSD